MITKKALREKAQLWSVSKVQNAAFFRLKVGSVSDPTLSKVLPESGPTPKSGFTLVEVLIVIALVAILAVIALVALNPTKQRQKLYDVKRKRDLSQLKGLYELYFTKNLRFPTGAEVCYDPPEDIGGGVCQCHICGLEQDVGTFSDTLQVLYCDPEHSRNTYLYQYDCTAQPGWYRLYASLSQEDPEGNACTFGVSNKDDSFLEPYPNSCGTIESGGGEGEGGGGGGGGGGPTATPTPTPPACPDDPVPKYCQLGGICNICGTYANCLSASACDQPPVLYSNSLCSDRCDNYGGGGPTATPEPTPTPFQYGSCPVDPDPKYCRIGGICNNCGLYNDCFANCDDPITLYANDTCNAICYEE